MFKYLQILYYKIKSALHKDMTILAIDEASKSTMIFKNGSVIETLPLNNSETIRGKRSKLPIWFDDFEYDEKELNEVLEMYMKK